MYFVFISKIGLVNKLFNGMRRQRKRAKNVGIFKEAE